MNNLSNKEQNIVLATIYLIDVNTKNGFVPDYELLEHSFDLSTEEKRDIRDLIQENTTHKY
jgi:hypothetical protein